MDNVHNSSFSYGKKSPLLNSHLPIFSHSVFFLLKKCYTLFSFAKKSAIFISFSSPHILFLSMEPRIFIKEIKEIHDISVKALHNLHKITDNTVNNVIKSSKNFEFE